MNIHVQFLLKKTYETAIYNIKYKTKYSKKGKKKKLQQLN